MLSVSFLCNLPSEGRETTQQDVGDDSSCPDVHLKAIPAQTQHTNRLNFSFSSKEENNVALNILFTFINNIRLHHWNKELKAQIAPKYLRNLCLLS